MERDQRWRSIAVDIAIRVPSQREDDAHLRLYPGNASMGVARHVPCPTMDMVPAREPLRGFNVPQPCMPRWPNWQMSAERADCWTSWRPSEKCFVRRREGRFSRLPERIFHTFGDTVRGIVRRGCLDAEQVGKADVEAGEAVRARKLQFKSRTTWSPLWTLRRRLRTWQSITSRRTVGIWKRP